MSEIKHIVDGVVHAIPVVDRTVATMEEVLCEECECGPAAPGEPCINIPGIMRSKAWSGASYRWFCSSRVNAADRRLFNAAR